MASEPKTLYDVLGVSNTATADEIKAAFWAKAKQCHPDLFPGDKDKENEFKLLARANTTLSDSDSRKAYDETGHDANADGSTKPDPFTTARSILSQIFTQLVAAPTFDPRRADIVSITRRHVETVMAQAKQQSIESKLRRVKMVEALARVKAKGDKPVQTSQLWQAINNQEQAAKAAASNFDDTVACAEIALKLLDEFGYDFEPRNDIFHRRGKWNWFCVLAWVLDNLS
jgi:curved DNA-binding protein CbpA